MCKSVEAAGVSVQANSESVYTGGETIDGADGGEDDVTGFGLGEEHESAQGDCYAKGEERGAVRMR